MRASSGILAATTVALAACGSSSGNSCPSGQTDVAGTWRLTDSCTQPTQTFMEILDVSQSGCSLTITSNDGNPPRSGTISGSQVTMGSCTLTIRAATVQGPTVSGTCSASSSMGPCSVTGEIQY